MNGLYFYKLVSPYENDITKECKLTITEIDSNFLNLKNQDIKNGEITDKTIRLNKNNGEYIDIELLPLFDQITDGFDVNYDKVDGIIKISYDESEFIIDDIITKSNFSDFIKNTENITQILQYGVFTDYSLKGNGTSNNVLMVSPIEKTGVFKPVIKVINADANEELPIQNIGKGDRYLVLKSITKYGLLYDFNGAKMISESLSNNGWRLPSKKDWDDMLNTIEPCEFTNHDSTLSNEVLGKVAGKLLKSTEGWNYIGADDINPNGIDSYNMNILPSGYGFKHDYIHFSHFGDSTSFWTSTSLNNTDVYTKVFTSDTDGVLQIADYPYSFKSIRLVKDYDGTNHNDVECVGGSYYKTILMPNNETEKGYTIWLGENVGYVSDDIEYLTPNDGDLETVKRYYIHEWDGFKWLIKEVNNGDSFVIINDITENDYSLNIIVNSELVNLSDFIYKRLCDVVNKDLTDLNDRVDSIDNKLNAEIERSHEKDEEVTTKLDLLSNSVDALQADVININNNIDNIKTNAMEIEKSINDEIERSIKADEELTQSISQTNNILNNEIERSISKDDEIETKISDAVSKMISSENHTYNCEEGVLRLKTNGENVDDIIISLDSNYGTF